MGVELLLDWDRVCRAVLAWLATYALHSTVLVGCAWLGAVGLARAAGRMRRLRAFLPHLRDRLWKVALVGALVTASLQTGFHLGPWRWSFPSEAQVSRVEAAPGDALPAAGSGPWLAPLAAPSPGSIRPAATLPATVAPTGRALTLPVVLVLLWLAGVAWGVARWTCEWNRLLRALDDRVPARSGPLHEVFGELRGRTAVDLRLAPSIHSPITLGLFRPEICVPPRLATELQRDEIAAVLAHELAHAERRDPAWLVACRAIEIVFFFQPLNRIVARWIADEAEFIADDRAVARTGERVSLASSLTEIAGWMVHDDPRLVSGMAARGTRLSLRVRRLLDEDHEPDLASRGTWTTAVIAPCGLGAMLLLPGFSAGTDAETSELRVASLALHLGMPVEPFPALVPLATRAGVERAPLDASFDELEIELESLREELEHRLGGDELQTVLDALDERLQDLRRRSEEVVEQLDELESSERPDPTPSVPLSNLSDKE